MMTIKRRGYREDSINYDNKEKGLSGGRARMQGGDWSAK